MTNRINVYNCEGCQRYIVTIDRAEGVTPAYIACRATPGCGGVMRSAFYRTWPWLQAEGVLIPRFEWYKPDEAETRKLSAVTRQHVGQGGLLLRGIARN